MGLLRLLSNPAIMRDDAIDRSQAWRTYDQLWADERVLWADEPAELDAVWRTISARDDRSHSCGPMTTWQPLPRLATPRW